MELLRTKQWQLSWNIKRGAGGRFNFTLKDVDFGCLNEERYFFRQHPDLPQDLKQIIDFILGNTRLFLIQDISKYIPTSLIKYYTSQNSKIKIEDREGLISNYQIIIRVTDAVWLIYTDVVWIIYVIYDRQRDS